MDYYVSTAAELSQAITDTMLDPEKDTIYITADIDVSTSSRGTNDYFFEFGVFGYGEPTDDALTINGLGHTIHGDSSAGLMRVLFGEIFIGNLTLSGGEVTGANGANQSQAANGHNHTFDGGGNGDNGQTGGVGKSALGAGLSIMPTASVALFNVDFVGNIARGGDGGAGGEGGDGGHSTLWHGGHGGNGGDGGEGGAAVGAIYNAGILRMDDVTYTSNLGIGGFGGQAGQGGRGGSSGVYHHGPDGQAGSAGARGLSEDNLYSFGHVYQDADLANVNDLFALYRALLDRTPDAQGLAYWKGILDSRASLAAIAQDFIDSYEYDVKTGASETDIDYLRKVYMSVLEREPEQAAQDSWVQSYDAGLLTRAELAAVVIQSEEAQQKINEHFVS